MEVKRFYPILHTAPFKGSLYKELMLHHFADDVSDENVGLLDARGAGGGDDEGEISDLCKPPPHRFQ
jgi:hypothetical protein